MINPDINITPELLSKNSVKSNNVSHKNEIKMIFLKLVIRTNRSQINNDKQKPRPVSEIKKQIDPMDQPLFHKYTGIKNGKRPINKEWVVRNR